MTRKEAGDKIKKISLTCSNNNWGTYNEQGIAIKTILVAIRFVKVMSDSFFHFEIEPFCDGSVSFIWANHGDIVRAHCYENGFVVYSSAFSDSFQYGQFEVNDKIEKSLYDLIFRVLMPEQKDV